MKSWQFEADYFTACNCDWGCPCNFNARPTEGRCMGWGAWRIGTGRFGATELDSVRFALFYQFPGSVEQGEGTACLYIDSESSAAQQEAIEAIGTGKEGGGIFELFGLDLVSTWLPTKVVPIDFAISDGVGLVRIDGIGEADSELLSYPDGSVIRPVEHLPHGIEFKQGLMTNARRWHWHDEDLLANYANKYGAVAHVEFTQEGCVG